MDITQNELKVMKAKELRRIVREAIEEVLNEGIAKISPNTPPGQATAIANAIKTKPEVVKAAIDQSRATGKSVDVTGASPMGEGELDEAKGYKLTNPGMDINQFRNKKGEPFTIAGVLLSKILADIRDNEGISDKQLFDKNKFNPETGVGFKKVQQLNSIMKGLKDKEIISRLGKGGEVEVTPEPGEEAPTKATEPEDLFMGGAENPLSMYFDDKPNADGSEDFTDSAEPEAGEVEKAEPTGGLSDEDYEAFMKYGDLKQRLDATKSNILKLRKSRATAGDIADKPSTELQRLRDLKKSLEDRISALVAGSDYLKKKLEKETPVSTPETPEEEETLEEGLDAYDIQKLKYYAGIVK